MTLTQRIQWFLSELEELTDSLDKKSVELLRDAKAEMNALNEKLKKDHEKHQKTRELLNTATGLLMRLEEHGFINTDDDYQREQLNHWRSIGKDTVAEAHKLLNQP